MFPTNIYLIRICGMNKTQNFLKITFAAFPKRTYFRGNFRGRKQRINNLYKQQSVSWLFVFEHLNF